MSTYRFYGWRTTALLALVCGLTACKKAEEAAAPAPVSPPVKVSVEAAADVPPPAPAPDAPAAAPDAAAPAPDTTPQPEGTAVSVYDTGTPAQRAAAAKSRRNLAWINAIKSGSDAEKQKARKGIDALPPAERAEFVEMIKLYGIPFP